MNLEDLNFKRIIWHILYWIAFFGLLAFFTGAEQFNRLFILVDIPIAIAYTYFTSYFLIPYFLQKGKILTLILIILIFSVLLSFIRLLNYDFIYYSLFTPGMTETGSTFSFPVILLNAKDFSFSLMIFLAVRYTRYWIISENREIETHTGNLESELRFLKAQVDPHFLFNTLNNLYSLSVSEPDKTRNVIKKIWGIMDFMVNEINFKLIRMDKEIKLIQDYADLELLRYGDRLDFSISAEGDFSVYKTPPLIFFPLVENCFKHGSAPATGKSMIRIRIREMNDRLRFETFNSVPERLKIPDTLEILKGPGISQVKARLNNHLPVRHKLGVNLKEDMFHLFLEIYF